MLKLLWRLRLCRILSDILCMEHVLCPTIWFTEIWIWIEPVAGHVLLSTPKFRPWIFLVYGRNKTLKKFFIILLKQLQKDKRKKKKLQCKYISSYIIRTLTYANYNLLFKLYLCNDNWHKKSRSPLSACLSLLFTVEIYKTPMIKHHLVIFNNIQRVQYFTSHHNEFTVKLYICSVSLILINILQVYIIFC